VQISQGKLALNSGGAATGAFNAVSGSFLIFGGGTYVLNSGSSLTSAGIVQVTGGTLEVNATVSVLNLGVLNGTLQIDSNGILNVSGNYDQQTTGTLLIQLGGTTAGAGYGQLNVTGTANIAGPLSVVYVNDYLPSLGDSFQVVTFGGRNGSFSSMSLPGLPPGEHWASAYDPNDFTLTVAPN
jgi:hypothetical protein